MASTGVKIQREFVFEFELAPPRDCKPTNMDRAVEAILIKKAGLNADGTPKEVMVDLHLIRREEGAFDVRVDSRNPEKIEALAAEFRANPARIPAIWVEGRVDADGNVFFITIDGRHREDGANKAGLKKIRAVVFYNLTYEERRQLAMINHMQAAQEHSKRDFKMVALEMLKNSCSRRPADKVLLKDTKNSIRAMWAGKKAKEEVEGIITWAARDYTDYLMNMALAEIREGDVTTKDAARKYGLPLARLQARLQKSGGRAVGAANISGHIAKEYKDFHKKVHAVIGESILQKQKGELLTENVQMIFQNMRRMTNDLMNEIKEGEIKLRAVQFGE